MNVLTIRRFLQKLRDFFPSRLPVGMQEFDEWASEIIDTYEFPDNDSIRFALASQIMHAPQTASHLPRRHYAQLTLKGMANQVAHAKFMEIKERQQARMDEEVNKANAQQSADATALTLVEQSGQSETKEA